MSQLLLGAIALAVALWLLKSFTAANPTRVAGTMRKVGGVAVMAVGGLLLLRGRIDIAIPLFVFGAGLAGWLPGVGGLMGMGGSRPSPGRRSQVRSAMLDMELDHDTGRLQGRVLAGSFAGRSLDELQMPDLGALLVETAADPDGRSLLEAYLDRRSPGWREDFQHDPAAGPRERRGGRNAMTKEEAYQILGVQPGAGATDIRRAHRALMKKLHPDQGGTTYLAARINEARDLLLGSHR
jgi:hypothetical protein